MENPSTFLSAEKFTLIIQSAADEIRSFLGFIHNPKDGSAYSSVASKAALLADLSRDMRKCASQFAKDPDIYSTEAMLKMGKGLETAIKNFIRIEVRKTRGVAGAAQVVAKGIEGDFRIAAMKALRKRQGLGEQDIAIKFAGRSSIEFNVRGVNKALPFKFLRRHWDDVLEMMEYAPGTCLDARLTRTAMAADGDGTIYGGPTLTTLPTLRESPVKEALNEFLTLGGIFILVSGNDLQRSAVRLTKGLDKKNLHRCLLVGNGAASMVVLGKKGRLQEVEDYRRKALRYLKDTNKTDALDVIYIGDDGHRHGNDMDAFMEVGLKRSFVAGNARESVHDSLRVQFVPGAMAGVKKLIKALNGTIRSRKKSLVFSDTALKEILRKARL